MKARAERSASAVTLHVFTTTTSAAKGSYSARARRFAAIASPSARAALQPKCSM